MHPPTTSIPTRSHDDVNPVVGITDTVLDGMFNGTDDLSSPDGKLGLDDG